MSSNYGSDFGSDDIDVIESSQKVIDAECALPSTPREPLTPRDSHLPATPPLPSQRKRKACDEPQENQAGSQRKTRASLPWKTPSKPTPSFQRTSSLTHQLPSPLTAPRIPPSPNHPPSSSQPTPSNQALTMSSTQHLPSPQTATRLPLSQNLPPSSSQPTPSRRPTAPPLKESPSREVLSASHEAPLYRFPFGSYSGKTLLEVPGFYLSCLRIDQAMADSMPGFSDALRLYDAGQPPIAPLPAPSLSLSPQKMRLKTESECLASPQKTPSNSTQEMLRPSRESEEHSTQYTESESAEYKFTFGIHSGKSLSAVPPDYIHFLKDRGIVDGRPDLKAAVAAFEMKTSGKPGSRAPAKSTDPSQYMILFGRHKGEIVSQIPDQYLKWLKTTDLLDDNADLRAAVYYELGKRQPKKAPKANKRRKPPREILSMRSYHFW